MKMMENTHLAIRKASRLSASAYRASHRRVKCRREELSRMNGEVQTEESCLKSAVQEKSCRTHPRRSVTPENPEVSARLTNLSLRHPGSRPAWFDFEPLALPGRTRQCKKVFWQIVTDHAAPQKRMIAMIADPGMGKSAFLAELHAMLENAPGTVMTLSPCVPGEQAFQAIRTILEQRFYISGDAPFDCIEKFVRGAVSSIVEKSEAESVCDGLLSLWRPGSSSANNVAATESASEPWQKRETTLAGRPVPMLPGKRVSTVAEVLGSHSSEPAERENVQTADENGRSESGCDVKPACILPVEPTILLPELQKSGTAPRTALEETDSEEREQYLERLKEPMLRLFSADLKQNALVIVLDDVERYDRESLALLSYVWRFLPEETRLTVILTSTNQTVIPAPLQECSIDFVELSALSDNDLAQLTHHILRKLSETREKLIVPKDICNLIAQRSYGNPKHAIALTLRHFSPDCMIHWNDAIEKLQHEPVPQRLCQNLARRYRDCPETKRIILQLASPLNTPFAVSTIECILTTWSDFVLMENTSCSAILKELREEGFLERVEDSFGANTPTYVFKHEYERRIICSNLSTPVQRHIYCAAAQWYSLNNSNGAYDEAIGDLWRNYKFLHEACRYYERAAYRALNKSQLSKAWLLFRKLLKSLPEGNVSARVQFSLDGAQVAFRTGQVDEAFRLCRRASRHAFKISAYIQAARANVQMASMLIELGCIRHVQRYISRACVLLNGECDPLILGELRMTQACRCLFMSKYEEAGVWLQKARDAVEKQQIKPGKKLLLDWIDAEIELNSGNPSKVAERLAEIIRAAGHIEDERIRAMAYRSLGNHLNKQDNLSGALEAWNIALGIVQETNDSVLHAQLLADISDGALELEALKTAKNVTEQCLGLAQQTHQKALIAHCLANTGYLQYTGGQYDKALRTLRKAHRSAITLKSVHLWTRTLSIFTLLYMNRNSGQFDPKKADTIHRNLSRVYSAHKMAMDKASHMIHHARVLLDNGMKADACNAYRIARAIYIEKGLERAGEKLQAAIDVILEETKA